MAWQTPKTNWGAADVPLPDDFNRIEGNVQELQDTKETPAGAQAKANTALTNAKAYTDAHEQKAAPHSGHETPAGAQAKANAAEANAKNHANSLVGTLSNLLTTTKNNVVAAINEIFGKVEDVEGDLESHLAEKATETNLGHVKVDGKTILSDNGVLKWSKNMAVFVHDGTFIVPPDVTTVFVTACGGGGGGGGGVYSSVPGQYLWSTGGSGGQGGCVIRKPVEVTPGEEIAVTIGAGGSGGMWLNHVSTTGNGSAGGVTSFGSYESVGGGGGGKPTATHNGTGDPGENGTSPIVLLDKAGSLFLPYGRGGTGGNGSNNGSPGTSGLLIIEW